MALVNPSRIVNGVGVLGVSLSTALVIVALAVAPFLTSGWVAFEQSRTGAAALTGYSPTDLRAVTDAILGDLVFGPADFDAEVGGSTVLTDSERSHMRDVRGVFTGFFASAAVALAIIGVAFWLGGRGPGRAGWSRRAAWHGLRSGALGLAVATIGAGVIALVAFDAAFEVFHRLFFASGTYRFDPATSRLVQLFPDAFWSETSVAVGGVIVVLAVGVAWLATRRLRVSAQPQVEPSGTEPGFADPPERPIGERGPAR